MLWINNGELYRSIQHGNSACVARYHELYRVYGVQVIISQETYDVHDLRVFQNHLYVVSTGTNKIISLSESAEVIKRWKFTGRGDAWHLNCLDDWDGRLVASAFGKFSAPHEWKPDSREQGIVLDLETGQTLWDGLSQPHIPRVDEFGNRLICDSETQRLLVKMKDGVTKEVMFEGYPRGLAWSEEYLHSLSGPARSSLALWPAKLRLDSTNLCPTALGTAVASRPCSLATEVYRRFLGQDFHMLDDDVFARRP